MTHTQAVHTKHSFLWKVAGIAVLGLALGFVLPSLFTSRATAEDSCTGNSGNLEGYILTQLTEDEENSRIYLSKASWDAAHPSDPADTDFYVSYDTEREIWSGRGWNKKVGWVDFNYDQQGRKARFVAPGEEYDRLHDNDSSNDEPVEWGNWRGVADLSGVRYDVQQGRFVGEAGDVDSQTGEGDEDEPVGSGEWKFDHVSLIKPECPEQINLLINRRSNYHQKDCPIKEGALTIQWTSEGVHNCKSIAGPWDLIARPTENTGTNVHNTSEIDGSASFKMKCVGDYTGTDVIKTAKASCGESTNTNDDEECEGDDCPIIAPKLIEA